MTALAAGEWPASYVIRVASHLDPHWASSLGLLLTHDPDGATTLDGAVTDQAELHGILSRIRDLGVPLLSVVSTHRGVAP